MRRAFVIVVAIASLHGCRRNREPRVGEVVPLVPPAERVAPLRPSPSTEPERSVPPPAARDSGVAFGRWVEGRPAPTGALGVRFGATRDEVRQRNADAGVTCRDADPYVFCPRATVDGAPPAIVTYEFCGDRLCTVALDGARTREPPAMLMEFDALVAMVQRELGPPPTRIRSLAAGCSSQAVCLHAGQSRLLARWAWHDGPEVSVVVDQVEDDQFVAQAAVTWISADRVRQGIPDPGPPPAADASAEGDADVDASTP
ncbi:MAG: hypothetical protein R3A52_21275 [Polyangiales bacterium]